MSTPFSLERWRRRVRVALGEEPADLVIAGGQVADVFSEALVAADVAIADGVIAGVGDYPGGRERIEAEGAIVAPAFIDAHIHTESSLLWLPEFARAVVPRGTGAVVTDPHEIANVAGLPGLSAMRAAAAGLPLDVRFTVPSCVPASPRETPGAEFGPADIAGMLAWPETAALGELMNFPGVLAGDSAIGDRLAAASGRAIDGHAPGLTGRALQAYAGSGPGSDHESTTLDEAAEKIRAGLMVMIRQGSSAKNLAALLPLASDPVTAARVCLCSDDRDAHDLHQHGHMDATLREAIALGLDPLRAIRLATWNAAAYWRMPGLGAVAPRYRANLAIIRDLRAMTVSMTLHDGRVVAADGETLSPIPRLADIPAPLRDTVRIAPILSRDLRLPEADARQAVVAIPGQIVTGLEEVEPTVVDGFAVSDPARDLLKLVCVERHHASGRIGKGLVRGFGLRRGAMASSIAHDAHNLVAVGCTDADLLAAIATVADSGGGLAVVADGSVIEHLPLPIAGLLSDQPLAETAAAYGRLERAARDLGSSLPSPFGLLAFMALSVIPRARVTDQGFITL
ncbi:MAG: adenine deaminase [Chloroflexota bacterium]